MVLNSALVKQHNDTMEKKDKNKSSGSFKIHNVGFYNPAPRQIKCLSYNKRTSKLALSRDDASIEIWDMRSAVYMEKCILGQITLSIEGLVWLDNRLFSVGLNGELIEWNLKELKPKNKVTLTSGYGGSCIDIDNANKCLAVGTNEGYLNTFSVDGDDLNPSKLFDKQEGPIYCCKYDCKGRFIVTGSTDMIRIWDVSNGHAIYRMSPSRLEKNREVHVLSLVVLKDLTIIAGDSTGCITVWNGENGTHIDTILNALDADVLAVAVNDEETMFCCSGVDPKIIIYVPIQGRKGAPRKWTRNFKRSYHDHDVKALTFIDEKKIISGGVSGFINVSCATKDVGSDQSYGPFMPQPCAVVAVDARLLLLRYFNHLEIWRLGKPNENVQFSDEDDNQRNFFAMHENQKKLVELKSIREEPITCTSLSPNGLFLVYSTENTIRLFQVDTTKVKTELARVQITSSKFTACAKVLFSSDSKYMFCVKNNGDIEIFSLQYDNDVDFEETIYTNRVLNDTISLVCLSKCGKYLVCAGACGTTAVWRNSGHSWSSFRQLTKQNSAPTAMAMHNKTNKIVLAFADYKIFEYDVEADTIVCATDASFKEYLTHSLKNTTDKPINNILLDENNENVVILQNDTFLFVLEKTKALTLQKKRKPEQSVDVAQHYKLIKHMGNYEHFVHMAWLSPSEIVAIVVSSVALIEQLPATMVQKVFGLS